MLRSIFDPRTLRGRLTSAYALALLIALCAYAVIVLMFLHEMEERTLDQQLMTAVRAVSAIVEEHDGTIALEETDRRQFYDILGQTNGMVLSRSGAPIVSNAAHLPAGFSLPSSPPMRARILTIGRGEERVRLVLAPLFSQKRHFGTVVAWRSIEWFGALQRWVFLGSLSTIALVAIPAIFMGTFIARRGLRPLEQIADFASEIEANDLSQRLDESMSLDELGRLSSTFNRMLDRLQAAFERQHRFTADASHELRAPLAVIAAEAKLALRRSREAESYQATLSTIVEVADEMQTMTESLLAAVRAEADVSTSTQLVDLREIAETTIERFASLADDRGVQIELEGKYPLRIVGNVATIGQALQAILHNAVKFAKEGGHVRVALLRENHEAVIRVTDDGSGFTNEGLTHALERFWRADASRTPGTGSGLGLAIAHAIVERMGGRIDLSNHEQGGAVVTLRFPRADE